MLAKEIEDIFKSTPPNVSSIVQGSLPIPFFGDYKNAQAATISLNPSDKEFLDRSGKFLLANKKRFESLFSLNCQSPSDLAPSMIQSAFDHCFDYFNRKTAYWSWFRHIENVLSQATGNHLTYGKGTLAHLDLSPWPTNPTWSKLSYSDQIQLVEHGLPFLKWLILNSDAKTFFMNGKTTCLTILKLFSARAYMDSY